MNELAPKTFNPQTLDEAMAFAKLIASSDMIPVDYKNKPGNVLAAVQMGAELGLHPMQAMQSIAVVNGRPSIWGDAALGLVEGSGLLESINESIEGTGDKAVAHCEVRRKGREPARRSFSVEDAKQAGLWGKNTWKAYPQRMLQMRARSWALRDVFSDVLKGLYVREESQDIPRPAEQVETVEGSRTDQVLTLLKRDHAAQVAAEAPAETVDTETGEVFALDATPVEYPTLAEVTGAMQNAANMEDLDAASDLARGFDDDKDKAVLREAYKAAKARIEK